MSAPFHSALLDALKQRVVIGDGAMGTMLQAADLTLGRLPRARRLATRFSTRPVPTCCATSTARTSRRGADAVETNTFGCNLPNLADYDIAHRTGTCPTRGTGIAREVADEMGPGRDGMGRFVLGSMGRAPKLPPSATPRFAVLRDALHESALGMIEGGADAILVETCQDCSR
ncbi:hypothetical protein GS937_16430 [Rhodococcus hoagii]|nr:hypothetical protein [Prescottella equi]